MAEQRSRMALTGLQWALGLVILTQSVVFLLPSAGPGFATTHMPSAVRLILGIGEIVGSVLLLVPRTSIRGAWMLAAVFLFAIAIHLLHGMHNVGNLVIYTAAAWAIAVGKAK
jgi:DoxX-like family